MTTFYFNFNTLMVTRNPNMYCSFIKIIFSTINGQFKSFPRIGDKTRYKYVSFLRNFSIFEAIFIDPKIDAMCKRMIKNKFVKVH